YAYERLAGLLTTVHGFDLEKARVVEAIKEEPENGPAAVLLRVQLAILYKSAQQTGPALDAAIDALRIDPVDPQAQRLLKDLFRSSGTTVEQEIAKIDSPLSVGGKKQADTAGTRTKGAILLAVGRETEAEASFRQVLAVTPSDAQTMVALASCRRIKGAVTEAIPVVRVSLQVSA